MSVTAAVENLAGEFTQAFLAERNPERSLASSMASQSDLEAGPAVRQRLALQQEPGLETLPEPITASPTQPPGSPPTPHHLQGLNYREALSHTFSPQELELTGWLRGAELREEYAIMRLFLLRMMQMTAGIGTLAEMIEFINIYGMSLLRLAKILETLNGGEDAGERLNRDLLEVADQVLKEKQQARFQEADDDRQDF
jgi:hypothetical protein